MDMVVGRCFVLQDVEERLYAGACICQITAFDAKEWVEWIYWKLLTFFRNGILERRNKFVHTKLIKFNDRPISNVKHIYLIDDT